MPTPAAIRSLISKLVPPRGFEQKNLSHFSGSPDPRGGLRGCQPFAAVTLRPFARSPVRKRRRRRKGTFLAAPGTHPGEVLTRCGKTERSGVGSGRRRGRTSKGVPPASPPSQAPRFFLSTDPLARTHRGKENRKTRITTK